MGSPAIIAVDRDGVVTSWNAGMGALLGYTTEEMIGSSMESIIPDEYRDAHWNAFRRAMAEGRSALHDTQVDFPARHRNGDEVAVSGHFALLAGGGSGLGAVLVVPG